MANSNENTQNTKDNQEKTADEGIQEHSEHTDENKQPESKDDVQNTDESTCLCKFFTKITAWICASENKNSNKAEENAAKNDDAAKQEEMKQADTVERPKEQVKLSDVLETISKFLSISAILGILIGGFIIFYYLHNIGQASIFPDIITNTPALITSTIIFGGILLSLYVQFYLCFIAGINAKPGKGRDTLKPFFYSLFFCLIPFLIYCCILYSYIKDSIAFLTLILLIVACLIVSFLVGIEKLHRNNILIFMIICVIPVYVISVSLFPSSKFALDSVHLVRFAETPKNSSWYLLHNNFQQNNGSQETNGINKKDLLKLKQKFKCSALPETERKKEENNIECSPHFEQRNNALYGFMAWNLGDTKVFCPISSINSSREELKKECIVISGKALQIMPESYISTDTDGIDDGNPENTGHDDPATDINTDVRFKNDLNAQSNTGLTNYNIQPVLPIQSNAKNMSIQINYGNCNPNSPKNKDGHPDMEYTDKKICQ
ncbi:O-antigen polymerase [Neisseria sicca]